MKRKWYIICSLIILLAACQENEMDEFDNEGAVYFQMNSMDWSDVIDSVMYSFAGKTVEVDTVKLQVNLMGKAVDYDRTIQLVVDAANTTAEEGVHFEALKTSYILPAYAYSVQIPVVLYGKDPQLENRSFQLALQLEATPDLQLGLSNRTAVRIIFSNRLTKPSYWDDYLIYNFGTYSKVKHEYCIQILGEDFPASYAEYLTVWKLWSASGKYMDNFFYENYPIYDENGNVIEPWL